MDDDTLPVIDLTDEGGEAALLDEKADPPDDEAVAARVGGARRWPRWTGLTTLVAVVAAIAGSGGVAWSSADRSRPATASPRAGDYADRLRCADGDPRVRNDLRLWDDLVSLPGARRLPLPRWLRDRSLRTTKIRTAQDAARWSNANTDAAVAFSTVSLDAWDTETRTRVERAEGWMRAWWSRQRHDVPSTWTEAGAVAAVRQAVLDDRQIVERTARSLRRSLVWRVLSLPPGHHRADTAVIGGTVRGEGRLAEVLVYGAARGTASSACTVMRTATRWTTFPPPTMPSAAARSRSRRRCPASPASPGVRSRLRSRRGDRTGPSSSRSRARPWSSRLATFVLKPGRRPTGTSPSAVAVAGVARRARPHCAPRTRWSSSGRRPAGRPARSAAASPTSSSRRTTPAATAPAATRARSSSWSSCDVSSAVGGPS